MLGRQKRCSKRKTKGEDINVGGKLREISECKRGNKVKRVRQERGSDQLCYYLLTRGWVISGQRMYHWIWQSEDDQCTCQEQWGKEKLH